MNINKPGTRAEEKLIAEAFELARQINDLAFLGKIVLNSLRIKDGYVFFPTRNTGYYIRIGLRRIHKVRGLNLKDEDLYTVARSDIEKMNDVLFDVIEKVNASS